MQLPSASAQPVNCTPAHMHSTQGAVQVIMSQLPNLEAAWWASVIGATMSLGYATVAIALGAREAGNGLGSLTGRPAPVADKVFGIFNALGNFGFAYSAAVVLLEVQVSAQCLAGLHMVGPAGKAALGG